MLHYLAKILHIPQKTLHSLAEICIFWQKYYVHSRNFYSQNIWILSQKCISFKKLMQISFFLPPPYINSNTKVLQAKIRFLRKLQTFCERAQNDWNIIFFIPFHFLLSLCLLGDTLTAQITWVLWYIFLSNIVWPNISTTTLHMYCILILNIYGWPDHYTHTHKHTWKYINPCATG